MSREKVKEIVDYMVSEGTQNTNYGCWALIFRNCATSSTFRWNGSMSTTMIFAANSTSVMRLLITSRTTTGTTIRWITTWFTTRTSVILRRRDIYGRTSQSR